MTKLKANTKEGVRTDFSLFDRFIDGFYAFDRNWRYIYINKPGARLAQKSVTELLGKRPQDVFSDAHALAFGETLKKVMTDGKPRSIEAYYPRYKKWYEDIFFPIREGVGLLARDVSRRKNAEDDQLRLSAIVSSSDDAIISKNLDGIITSWNRAAQKMFGYTAEEIIGKSIRTIIPPELQKEEDIILAKLRKGKRIEHYQTVRITKSGERKYVSLTISPMRSKAGNVFGASKIIRDITKEKRNEENLKFLAEASKELSVSLDFKKSLHNIAKLAISHIADWCTVEMLDGNEKINLVTVTHKNQKMIKWAVKLWKDNPPTMRERAGVANVLRTGISEFYPHITDEILARGARNANHLALLRKLQLKSVIIAPIKVRKKAVGVIVFISSVSGNLYTKSDLSMAEELARRASLALENAKLYQDMQKELMLRKKLERQKDEFVGIASHELKTPVTSLKAFAQVLQNRFAKAGDERSALLLRKMDAQINKLNNLIQDLLDISKIEAGMLEFHNGYFHFDELIDEVIEEIQRTTDKHTIKRKGRAKKIIYGDRERIGQVITNFLTNAIKYSPHADTIDIIVSSDSKEVVLCVQDYGVGIPTESLSYIFDRFYRVPAKTHESVPGMGIGLYVSSEFIKRQGGTIWAESEVGKGSRFCFRLPVKNKQSTNQ